MTTITDGNYIKAMFGSVSFMMVVFCRWCVTRRALQRFHIRQCFVSNGCMQRCSSLIFFRIKTAVPRVPFIVSAFAFFALCVSLSRGFTFFGLNIFFVILVPAGFTFSTMTISSTAMSRKFRQRFDLFANIASFRYDRFRHGLFLLSKGCCLEPIVGNDPTVGLFYFT